eukprot:15066401-Heterocapsa_arctica.AAC.1
MQDLKRKTVRPKNHHPTHETGQGWKTLYTSPPVRGGKETGKIIIKEEETREASGNKRDCREGEGTL